jgi:hypothetical protein
LGYIPAIFGELAEWLRSGLQIRAHRFDSGTRLQDQRHDPAPVVILGEPGFDPAWIFLALEDCNEVRS